jgi:hypothetical protein
MAMKEKLKIKRRAMNASAMRRKTKCETLFAAFALQKLS